VKRLVAATGLGALMALFGLMFDPQDRLIWNRTGSAPEGLYWRSDEPFSRGKWVAVSAASAHAKWAEAHGYVGRNWPLLKEIAAGPGDTVCRTGAVIYINGTARSWAKTHDVSGSKMPSWEGCERLGPNRFFLLSPHPASLNGRYFGIISGADLDGVIHPILLLPE